MLSGLGYFATLSVAVAEDFGFDVSGYEKQPFELRGYAEIEPTFSISNESGALYHVTIFVGKE